MVGKLTGMSPDGKRKGGGVVRRVQEETDALSSRKGRIAIVIVVVALLGNLLAGVIPFPFVGLGPADAANEALTTAQAELKAAKAELAAEQARLDEFAQKQEDAEVRLETTQDRIAEVEADTHKAEAKLARLQTQLSERLVEIYKDRGSQALAAADAVFSGEDKSIGAVLDRLAMVTHVAEQDGELVAEVTGSLEELDQLNAELTTQKAAEQEDAAQYAAARDQTLQELEQARDQYNGLRSRVAQLEEEERQRQEEARRVAEAKAAAQAAAKAEAAQLAAAEAAAAQENSTPTTETSTAKTDSTSTGKSTTTTAVKSTTTTSVKSTTTTKKPTPKPDPVVDTSAGWVFPVQGPNSFVDSFGAPRSGGRTHKGCDIMTARGTPLVAVVSGTIRATNPTDSGLGGITIHLTGSDGNVYYYAHLSSIKSGIKSGVHVDAGQVIGAAGNTGNASGGAVHLHFEIRPGGGSAIDPYPTLIKYR
jgi:peptidoglycan LD-endopeptidase LytH